jgi:ABC-type branched-subunit amino acid transport system ATPase component
MKQDVKYQELDDEQLERVVGGQGITRSFNAVQLNLNITVQNAVAVAFGGNATAANLNATRQSNRFVTSG